MGMSWRNLDSDSELDSELVEYFLNLVWSDDYATFRKYIQRNKKFVNATWVCGCVSVSMCECEYV